MSYDLNEWDAAQDQTTMTAHLRVIPQGQSAFSYSSAGWPYRLDPDEGGMSIKFATIEPSRTRCNGTYKWPTRPESSDGEYVGGWYELDNLSDVTITFNTASAINGVTVIFDDRGEEWATDYTIELYDENDALLHSESVTDNTSPYHTIYMSIADVKTINLHVDAWNVADAEWAKVAKFVPYVDYAWSGRDIYSYEKQVSINPFESSLTIPEARLVVADPEHAFVPLSQQSVADSLRQGMPITCHWVTPAGRKLASEWLLYDWSADSDQDEATFIMRPPLGFGRQMTQTATTTSDVRTIGQGLLDRVGMTLWSVEAQMMTYNCFRYFGENLNVETAVQQLANSVGALVDFTDDCYGIGYRYYHDALNEERFIDGDQLWEEPNVVQQKPYKEIVVIYSALQDGSITEKTYTRTINRKGQGTFTVYAQNASAQLQAQEVCDIVQGYLTNDIIITCQLRGDPDMRPWQVVSLAVEGTSILGVIEKVKTTYTDGILTTECEVRTDGSGE